MAVTIAGDRTENLDLCSALRAFEPTPTATRDLSLYGLIRKTSIHIPQWGSNSKPQLKDHQIFEPDTLTTAPRGRLITKQLSDWWDHISDGMSRLLSIQRHNIRVHLDIPWIPFLRHGLYQYFLKLLLTQRVRPQNYDISLVWKISLNKIIFILNVNMSNEFSFFEIHSLINHNTSYLILFEYAIWFMRLCV